MQHTSAAGRHHSWRPVVLASSGCCTCSLLLRSPVWRLHGSQVLRERACGCGLLLSQSAALACGWPEAFSAGLQRCCSRRCAARPPGCDGRRCAQGRAQVGGPRQHPGQRGPAGGRAAHRGRARRRAGRPLPVGRAGSRKACCPLPMRPAHNYRKALHSTFKTCSQLVGRLCRLLLRPASRRACRAWPRACPSASERLGGIRLCSGGGARLAALRERRGGDQRGRPHRSAQHHAARLRSSRRQGCRQQGCGGGWRLDTLERALERASAPAVSPGCLRRSGRLVLLCCVQPPIAL